MPSTSSGMSLLHTPRLVLSNTTEEDEKSTSRHRESLTPTHGRSKEQDKTQSEWVDIEDNSNPRRRKKSRRSIPRPEITSSSPRRHPRQSASDLGRFLPKLSQISESNDARTALHTQPNAKDRHRDDASVGYRRSVRGKNVNVQRRQDPLLRVSPSLISVLSSLTASTDRSSGSNSTITQRSYSRDTDVYRDSPIRSRRTGEPTRHSTMSRAAESRRGFLQPSVEADHEDDAQSDVSTSTTSSRRSSDAGSSVLSGTPSSRSTYPSPTFSRDTAHETSTRPNEHCIDSARRSYAGRPHHREKVNYTHAKAETSSMTSAYDYPGHETGQFPTNITSSPSVRSESDLAAPVHSYPHDVMSSTQQGPPGSEENQLMMQKWHAVNNGDQFVLPEADDDDGGGDDNNQAMAPPPAPEAPDVTKKTLVGYEMLASELCSSSDVKPLYRKFEFLNHRLLLHLQDELAELEEQLRTVDEIVAQMEPESAGKRAPSSRRGEAYYGVEIHHHRTNLLGRIFQKTEQYNKAMSSYSSMLRNCETAEVGEVEMYRSWMAEHAPIHEVETRFLHREKDLVVFDQRPISAQDPRNNSWIVYTPLLGGLPMVLLGLIPHLLSRLVMLAAFILASTAVVFTTRIRHLLDWREWLVLIVSYAFCFIALALCIPQGSDLSRNA